MPRWTFCPQCDAELFVPDDIERGVWAQCPDCQATFELDNLALRPLAEVVPIDGPPPRDEPTTSSDPAEKQRAVTLADLMPPPAATDEPAESAAERSSLATPSDLGKTLEFAPGMIPAADHTDFELDDSGPELADLPADEATPAAGDDEPSLPGSDWSEGTGQLDEWLARAERETAAEGVQPETSSAPSTELADGAGPADGVAETISVSPTPPRRRKRSAVRTMVGVVLGGLVGLSAGYYVILMVGGPDADALELAQYLPDRVLPDSFRSQTPGPGSGPIPPAPSVQDRFAAAPLPDSTASQPATQLPGDDQPAEVPASFAMPVEPPATTDAAAANDRYGFADIASDTSPLDAAPVDPAPTVPAEPPRFDAPAALPLATSTPHVVDAPSYTADQLRAALSAAQQAQAGLVDGSLDDPTARRTKADSYIRFCELAETLTFADDGSGADALEPLEQAAARLFAETLAGANTRSEVARIATIWIPSPNRRSGGVLLTGKIVGRSTLGDVDECQLDTEQGTRITVLVPSQRADGLEMDQELGIVGSIVEAPSEHVSGYTGSAPQAVWVDRVLRLP